MEEDEDLLLLMEVIDDAYPAGNPPEFYRQATGVWERPEHVDFEIYSEALGAWVTVPEPAVI